jgi:hypothetical protein
MNSSDCTRACEECDQLCIAKVAKFIVVNASKLPIVSGSVDPLDISCQIKQDNVILK